MACKYMVYALQWSKRSAKPRTLKRTYQSLSAAKRGLDKIAARHPRRLFGIVRRCKTVSSHYMCDKKSGKLKCRHVAHHDIREDA